jgi:hypothetical protein
MTLEEVIVNQLRAYAPLTALVGTRIYPSTYPQNATLPVVIYQQTSRLPEYSHDGACGAEESRFQISSVAPSYSIARQTADAIRGALKPWEDHQDVQSGITIGGVFMEDELPIYAAADVESQSTHHILGDYRFLWGN